MNPSLALAAVLLSAPAAPLADKTLVAWVHLADLTQRGGSVLTLADDRHHFDAVVFGEIAPGRWMAGSEMFRRTHRKQDAWPAETADPHTPVQIAVVYRGRTVTTFRNGVEYAKYEVAEPHRFGPDTAVVIGPRHPGCPQSFAGRIADARVYDRPLTAEQLVALRPDQPGELPPWAWWTFDDTKERTGRFPHARLARGAAVVNGALILPGNGAALFAATSATAAEELADPPPPRTTPPEKTVLHYHLMHPGGDSLPGDPNAAFCLDGVYHLHYILRHPWNGRQSFSFVHVTSPDMLHWTWQSTKLQPAFTGHGMFSGTGFLTADGRPAAIYHGEGSGRNQIAVATDRKLTAWEKPYPVDVRNPDGSPMKIHHWDPDCFRVGDMYYAISGGENPPLLKSKDLKTWAKVGDFLRHDLPDTARGEDISCPNFFQLGDKWMLLCISHDLGCRYYLGDWDAKGEQFVPQKHGRMNWRRESQSLFSRSSWRSDFFAPESVQTPDGRRVMWAWLATIDRTDGAMSERTLQSLPRELSLPADGVLRIKPLRELEGLRREPVMTQNITIPAAPDLRSDRTPVGRTIAKLPGEAAELRVVIPREQAARKLFGFTLFADGQGGGLPVVFRPETGALRVGTTEAPFNIGDLPAGEDVTVRVFVDRYLVEVFVNDRQALVGIFPEHAGRLDVSAFSVGAPTTLKSVEVWKIEPTNQGFREAQTNRVWEPRTK